MEGSNLGVSVVRGEEGPACGDSKSGREEWLGVVGVCRPLALYVADLRRLR